MHPSIPPKCQCIFGDLIEGEFRAYGCGIRIDLPDSEIYLLSAQHVWAMFAGKTHFAVRGPSTTVVLAVETFKRNHTDVSRDPVLVDTDVVAIPITASEASQTGITKADIASGNDNKLPVSICGPCGVGSVAPISPSKSVFGYYQYEGSTDGGFSGAAYCAGKRILAMHLAGGIVNHGYSVQLAYVTLCALKRVKEESSESWLEEEIRDRRRTVWVDQNYGDPSEVRINVRGKFHVVQRSALAAAASIGIKDISDRIRYVDYVNECAGNAKTGASGAPSSSTPSALDTEAMFQSLMKKHEELSKLINKSTSKSGGKPQKKTTSGPQQKPAQGPA
uniref:Serine protease n=1 Tax=Riboviria sp. TaxID=2585031 RepID=A0A8K1U2P1_9VIRU|nr:MAG: hypothetical protein 1 [Riboviria sp.]